MGVITLNVLSSERGVKKTMQFEPTMLVYDACKIIREKMGMNDTNPNEYGLFRVEEDETRCVWMENGRALEHYLLRNQDSVEYRRKLRMLRVRMLDNAIKTIPVDESLPVGQVMLSVCAKIGISNYEEYSLVREGNNENGRSVADLRVEKTKNGDGYGSMMKGEKIPLSGTLGRNKEKKMEQLRQKLQTDEELNWVDHGKTLREQGIGEDEVLLLRRKYFFSDTNVDSRDPVQLNLLYVQCRDGVLRGLHPVSKETACQLGALQSQIQYGDFPENKPKFFLDGRDVLPKEYAKSKENEKKVVQLYRELTGLNELEAKSRYVQLCRGLNTYGVTFFLVKEKLKGKNKLVPRLLGVNKESVMRVDEKTKEVLKEWPLEQVRKWAPTPRSFTLDFGDYADGFYTVQTADGEKIAQLIGGYIDIIIKKKQIRDHLGIEGDEGSTMLEDIVAPARATLVSHGQIGAGQHARDGHVAVPGVLRSAAQGYGINGAQYGAVSGQITNHSLTRSQRGRIEDPKERAQRALIGTIEATIRAVEEAEEEMDKEPEIQLPKFPDDPASRRLVDDRVEVGKERVNERLAAMGAATAQVVQWTAVKEEYDDRVGTAVATIGSNIPEVGRDVRELAATMPEPKRGDLVGATRQLCRSFGDFLNAVNPEHDENRTTVLAAASRVGDYSRNVITTIEEETTIQTTFTDGLMQRAKDVASSTAQLVQRAKTISAACQEPEVTDRVIQSATKTAFATSQLVACTRVVAPTIDKEACQTQLTSAAKEVARSVDQLLVDAQSACQYDSNVDQARRNLGDIHAAARQVTNALDGLLGHIRTNPKLARDTQHDRTDEYERLLRSSNQLITHQGPSHELVKHGEKVIRHSQILVEEFEREADERPENRQKLLDAARRVADATSNMIDATKEVESRPGATDSQMALRTAAERLAETTTEATSDRQAERTMHQLEQAAKQVAYNATQTIAAASAVKQKIHSHVVVESLVMESSQTGETMPRLISSIRESQNATTPSDKFRAQSRLIRDSHAVLEPASRLVDVARNAVVHVPDNNMASHLQKTTTELNESLTDLRIALNNAQQLNFSQQLVYSEELIKELDADLKEIQAAANAGRLQPLHAQETSHTATSALMGAARQVGSTLAQLVSASVSNDRQHIGASSVEAAQALRTFTAASRSVCATKRDLPVDNFILNARSVVHDSGRVFDRVREDANPAQLADAARQVSNSLRQCVGCIPQHQHIESAITKIRSVSSSSTVAEPDVVRAASRLAQSTSDLVVAVRAPSHQESVNVFVTSYSDFYSSVMAALPAVRGIEAKAESVDLLEKSREQAVEVLNRAALVAGDSHTHPDAGNTQSLATSTRQLTETVSVIVENVASSQKPWEGECDAALRQIQSVRHLVEQATLPVNDNSYFGSLDQVTEHSRSLGEAMTGIARNAKQMETGGREETARFCQSVRQSADAVCSLAEAAAQSAYLVGVAHPKSVRGVAAIVDGPRLHRSAIVVNEACERMEKNTTDHKAILQDLAEVAKHTSLMASLCRDASDRSSAVTVKKQFIHEAAQLAAHTSSLFQAAHAFDERPNSAENFTRTAQSARELTETVQSLEQFVNRPDFSARPAQISHEGRQAQVPVLTSTRRMLDASAEMISTARQLAASPRDASTWQHIAADSKGVSDSIKSLVAAIRDAAPGQAELDTTIRRLEELIVAVERREMEGTSPARQRVTNEKMVHQQIIHGTQSLIEKVEGLRNAACSKEEELAQRVEEHLHITEPLAAAACDAAEVTTDSRTQTSLFEQTKTVIEAELEMMRNVKEAAGNTQAIEAHGRVNESAEMYRQALHDMHSFVNRISSEQGVTHGMVETITRSIALTDEAAGGRATESGRSFADSQTNMTMYLEEIGRIATDLPSSAIHDLGPRSLHLSETYKKLAIESHQAIQLSSPEQAQRLKVAVQRLGSASIHCVKKAGTRQAYPNDGNAHREMNEAANEVLERVREVLAALHHGSKGTQACINAANTVSGIIGDLDTTILFATSGSLHAPGMAAGDFTAHREEVIKTARALLEDTKALVAGAASNQEQLAVAAQNAVKTMIVLTDVVKNGALTLSADHNSEGQVSVMHACRDVAAALSSLIHATKNASGRSLKDPAMDKLKQATKLMLSNVTLLLRMVKSVEDKEHKGTLALEAAEEAIYHEIQKFEMDSGEGPSSLGEEGKVTADHLMRATKGVMGAATKLGSVGASLDQEEAIAAANLARAAVSELLRTTRLAAYETDSAEGRYTTVSAGREVAMQVRSLMRAVHTLLRQPGVNTREALVEPSRALAKALKDLTGCGDYIKGEMFPEEKDATAIAENELLGAAMAIDVAAVKLAELRPRDAQPRINETMTFDETILSAAKSITTAVATLVKAASEAQRELVAQGRGFSHDKNAKGQGDYQWSEGLISAARFVAAAVQQLCEAANSLVQGQASEEKLISAAKQVASSTAQLLIACNVRADQGSQANRRLQAAGGAVKHATERLVAAARQMVTDDERTVVISEKLVSGIAQVMNAKEAVLRKEKELVEARERLAKLNQQRYEKGMTPEE